jgi:putative Mn2+ efflux pump MntP
MDNHPARIAWPIPYPTDTLARVERHHRLDGSQGLLLVYVGEDYLPSCYNPRPEDTIMPFWTIFLIAIGLAMDCFTVSLGVGTAGTAVGVRPAFRLLFHFGIFQAGMTLLGWLAGKTIVSYISNIDHWVAFGLLLFVGLRMIRSGLRKEGEDPAIPDPSRGLTLIMLSVATSIDALAVGLSLALLAVNVFWAALLIGVISAALSLAGLLLGNQLGLHFGKSMEILGGAILIGIGLRVLITHLFG